MSDKRIAFVFDTNFIVQNQRLDETIKQLNEKYVPYVTQVSIEERKAKHCRDKKNAYAKVKELGKQIGSLMRLKGEEELNEELKKIKNRVQQNYEKCFEGRIIKYDITSESFNSILCRAFDKIPPFSDSENASDKGFKDTILWLSLMEYFKCNGENEVIFLTDDKGFTNKSVALINEFKEYTGKAIQINNNSEFSTFLENKNRKEPIHKKEIPNIDSIRKELGDILDRICWSSEYNYFGQEEYSRNFTTRILFDEMYTRFVMDNLGAVIQEHLFDDQIKISVFLDKDNRIQNDRKIDMALIEKFNKLYIETSEKYPEHITALINTITEKLNENYEETGVVTDLDLPF